ncbi:MAG TPA: hypothetical protein VFP84_05290 [Kofleriaceae bacterium]|nr:hypothetical protein [Kofleriaceae bacterium]
MRTPLLAAFLGLSLAGCLIGDSGTPGTGGGGDDGTGDPGTGSDPAGNPPPSATPDFTVAVDHNAVTTDLLSTNMVTATVHATGGFTGMVNLTAAVTDANGAPLEGWTVTMASQSVNITANGDTPIVATVNVPAMSASLTGKVTITATPATGTVKTIDSMFTVNNQITIPMSLDGTLGTCAKTANPQITIAQGTKVHWVNADTTSRVVIHIQNNGTGITGFAHEPNPGMAPATATTPGGNYDQTANSAGSITWYCHAPGDDKQRYTITAK